jgi:hypothetical protein
MVLTVSFALSPATGLVCHRRLADTSAKLDASVGASGPHDFTVRNTPFVRAKNCTATYYVHRIPHPTSVTIAKRPSDRDGMCLMYCCFYQCKKRNIFRKGAGHKIAKGARRANHPLVCAAFTARSAFAAAIQSGRRTSALVRISDSSRTLRHFRKVPEGDSEPPPMTIKEATNGGPLAQPAAFRVVTSARRPRSRPRGSWRIYCQRRSQAAPPCR